MPADASTGWYGKLPGLGDFASRRLPSPFVEAWDDWLAAGLASWRAQKPDGWLEGYLASPSWRFVLMPGVMAATSPEKATAWAGVLMPSVDRVGRYFPLTLAHPLPALPADVMQVEALLGWLKRLDDLALDALHDDWSVDLLETELAHLPAWVAPPAGNAGAELAAPGRIDFQPAGGVAAWLAAGARDALLQRLRGKAIWLSDDSAGQPTLRITDGLPAAADFPAFISSATSTRVTQPSDLGEAS
jgi:type VI secretion system protein ImpM